MSSNECSFWISVSSNVLTLLDSGRSLWSDESEPELDGAEEGMPDGHAILRQRRSEMEEQSSRQYALMWQAGSRDERRLT